MTIILYAVCVKQPLVSMFRGLVCHVFFFFFFCHCFVRVFFYITSLNVPLISSISLTWLWTIVQIQTQCWLILGRPLSNCWLATILSIKLRHICLIENKSLWIFCSFCTVLLENMISCQSCRKNLSN